MFRQSGGNTKIAITMGLFNANKKEAEEMLEKAKGSISRVLEEKESSDQ